MCAAVVPDGMLWVTIIAISVRAALTVTEAVPVYTLVVGGTSDGPDRLAVRVSACAAPARSAPPALRSAAGTPPLSSPQPPNNSTEMTRMAGLCMVILPPPLLLRRKQRRCGGG